MPREHNGAHDQRWVPPNPGFFKVHVGRTFEAVSGRGEMVEAMGFRSDALEAMNAEDGLKFLVEGDAQGIVKMLEEEECSLDSLIRDTCFFSSTFMVSFFSFCFL
ncbi:hypothetical protein RHMOL_Rhmol13G0190400 [Rhododendron molle]|uniref:Uncharacterized protein n=1 Tax=Rhododendron molle TaxID=49168 RepID=A0ACC0L9P1_RHOML|nr:hypothetical protein RHMOL_Rhmol13G0190400 [Rhododendron molle]